MATSVRLIRRYVWLIDTIRRAGQITLQEINDRWAQERTLRMEGEGEIPERTFHRHRQAIADIFGIDILCNRFNGNSYYIDNCEALNEPTFTSWLFNGLAIDNQLLTNQSITSRILFENTPGGTNYLPMIIEAIGSSRIILLTYKRFSSDKAKERMVEPHGLKQSGNRWYLIGKIVGLNVPTVFALDRIESITLTETEFKPDNSIDIGNMFNDVIGVNIDSDYPIEKIILRIYGLQRSYLDTLPLHKSQQLIHHTKDYSDYELTLSPEYEFQRALLALGPDAEVLSPLWLREEIKNLATETLKHYTRQ